jgi:hypothetical protein
MRVTAITWLALVAAALPPVGRPFRGLLRVNHEVLRGRWKFREVTVEFMPGVVGRVPRPPEVLARLIVRKPPPGWRGIQAIDAVYSFSGACRVILGTAAWAQLGWNGSLRLTVVREGLPRPPGTILTLERAR